MINLDKPNYKYLVPISPISLNKIFDNLKSKLVNFINLDKPNPKYLIPISPISFYKYLFIILNLNILILLI